MSIGRVRMLEKASFSVLSACASWLIVCDEVSQLSLKAEKIYLNLSLLAVQFDRPAAGRLQRNVDKPAQRVFLPTTINQN
jgi:hypothetical protein